jgi:hypothetical protein
MIRRRPLAPFLLTAVLLGTACTEKPGVYPSLAPRPIESRSDAEPVVPPPGPVAADPELDRQIAAAMAAVDKAHAAYTTAADKAESAAGKPGSQLVGSDSWVGAQAALADLDAQRSATTTAASQLEQLITGRGVAGEPPYPALDDAYAKAQAVADAEVKRTAAIKARLGEK